MYIYTPIYCTRWKIERDIIRTVLLALDVIIIIDIIVVATGTWPAFCPGKFTTAAPERGKKKKEKGTLPAGTTARGRFEMVIETDGPRDPRRLPVLRIEWVHSKRLFLDSVVRTYVCTKKKNHHHCMKTRDESGEINYTGALEYITALDRRRRDVRLHALIERMFVYRYEPSFWHNRRSNNKTTLNIV